MMSDKSPKVSDMVIQHFKLFVQQVWILSMKHIHQKQRKGRVFLKETFLIPFAVLMFVTQIMYTAQTTPSVVQNYDLHDLPPLSSSGPWGIFSSNSNGNPDGTLISRNLYYSPNNHVGVNQLMEQLVETYPSIKIIGMAFASDVTDAYTANLFDTWGAVEFTLTAQQTSTGLLIPDQSKTNPVNYNILMSPVYSALPTDQFVDTDMIYNDQQCEGDAFWSTGYMTLENFISTYLAKQYDTTPADFAVKTFIQRYPKSPIYPDKADSQSMSALRWSIWRWIGPTMLSICMFIPMLSLLTENVRERQFKMKDLLEISGLMNVSYWFSYLFVVVAINQLTIWFCVAILTASNILTDTRAMPYIGLMTVYCIGLACFSMFGGFLVNRSEYYGLPVFLINTALTVAGGFMTLDYDMPVSAKLFVCFLHPSIAFTFGTFSIETFLQHHPGQTFDADFTDHVKNYPSLNSIVGVIIASSLVYMFLCIGMPFDWLQTKLLAADFSMANFVTDKEADLKYPCDDEAAEERKAGKKSVSTVRNLLKVKGLSHVYPDGTNAVKDISFSIKEGEVLSFLGANGAGKSTCMGMLCGTLEATIGDALVNGFSISNDRTRARRNLGIAMQQDIIWDDVSVEDHLYLFGSLRGMFGRKLRDDVDKMVESLGFPEKRKSMAGTLSGGQKRRLCVGISMVGGNSVVYLDEPTAGLDPVSRRQLWELVEKNRAGRAILLTTHFMDEADVLGDRIAIVKEGRLRALGTSKFLKKRFGLGYLLKMSLSEGADVKVIVERVTVFVPEVSTASNAGTELSLRLPKESVSQFPALFEALEGDGVALGVLSYGIETTTLEEVFMRIVNEDSEQLLTNHAEANRLLTASATERDDNVKLLQKRDESRNPLRKSQISALLTKGTPDNLIQNQAAIMVQKRFHQFTRSRGQWALGLVCPLLMTILACAKIQGMPKSIVASDNEVYSPTFSSQYATPLTGPGSQIETQALFESAFGSDQSSKYLGETYNELNSYISEIATDGVGTTSTAGIYYESISNFTVMYNASYPINFAGAVSNMLNAATLDVTGNRLVATNTYQSLPNITLFSQVFGAIMVAMLMALFAGSIGAGMSIVVGGERTQLVKHQQLASGASRVAYWISNFVFDFVLMFLLCIIFTIILSRFSPSDYNSPSGFSVIVAASIPFSIASVFRFYVVSFFVDDVRMAQTIYFYGSLFTMFALLVVFIITCFNSNHGDVSSPAIQALAVPWTLIDPAFGWFLIVLFQHNFLGVKTQNEGADFLSEIAASEFFSLIAGCFIYFTVLVLIEGGWREVKNYFGGNKTQQNVAHTAPLAKKNLLKASAATLMEEGANQVVTSSFTQPALRIRGSMDPDVAAEREKVDRIVSSGSMTTQDNAILVSNIKKVYYGKGSVPAKIAVRNVSVSIPHGEVFGLLGANGAGKTTLLKMVSGQELPSSGFALINGFDVVRNTSEAQRSMGLCPQFDTLVERLTVKENLLFFGQIKGLSGLTLIEVCEAYMVAMNIKKYQNKLIQQLSGGNRRKVSLAVALMGAPPTVYLDEPSTGLDPVASRLMWRLLSKISSVKQTAIVLTTHNMLECEAVCTRICIMKLGEMVCLGDSQHLRSTHGTGFLLEMTLASPEVIDLAKQFVTSTFELAEVVDEHATMINFEIPKSSIAKLSTAFRLLESKKQELGIVDYALSQSTLEQVFLKQIRPNDNDHKTDADQRSVTRKPTSYDMWFGYAMWGCALFIPGLHHFYLGNTSRGFKYLFTANEMMMGWLLDGFEMHVLIQASVQEHGHTNGLFKMFPRKEENKYKFMPDTD